MKKKYKDVKRLENGSITQVLTKVDIVEIVEMSWNFVNFMRELYTKGTSKFHHLRRK